MAAEGDPVVSPNGLFSFVEEDVHRVEDVDEEVGLAANPGIFALYPAQSCAREFWPGVRRQQVGSVDTSFRARRTSDTSKAAPTGARVGSIYPPKRTLQGSRRRPRFGPRRATLAALYGARASCSPSTACVRCTLPRMIPLFFFPPTGLRAALCSSWGQAQVRFPHASLPTRHGRLRTPRPCNGSHPTAR